MPHSPRRALIVIDVQNEYFTGNLRIEYPDPAESLSNITQVMDVAHAAGIPVVRVRHLLPADAPVFAKGSLGAGLHPQISARPYDLHVEKTRASALAGTELGAWLRERRIDTLTLVGYMTHNCIDATARQAVQEGWKVEVLYDATGSVPYLNEWGDMGAEAIHRVFCLVLHTGFAAVVKTVNWLRAVEHKAPTHPDNIYLSNQRAVQARH